MLRIFITIELILIDFLQRQITFEIMDHKLFMNRNEEKRNSTWKLDTTFVYFKCLNEWFIYIKLGYKFEFSTN